MAGIGEDAQASVGQGVGQPFGSGGGHQGVAGTVKQSDGLPDLRHDVAQVDAGEQTQALGEGGLVGVIRWGGGAAERSDHVAPARIARA